jgi:acyl carrier protein
MNIIGELERFLISDLALDLEPEKQSFTPEEDLIATGIIDSFGILKLTAFIEKTFCIKITDEDIAPHNFRTITSLKQMIEAKTTTTI